MTRMLAAMLGVSGALAVASTAAGADVRLTEYQGNTSWRTSAGMDDAVTRTPIPNGSHTRVALTAASLTTGDVSGPWPMEAFSQPLFEATAIRSARPVPPTRNEFQGRLRLLAELPLRGFRVLVDRYGDASANGAAATHLPAFDFEFVQSDDALIPVRRGSIPSDHPEWEFILEPGWVWDEPEDAGYSRAALPFSLEERNANCMHNGVLTFLFRSDGAVSDVAFEIAQETCAYFQFDWWGYAEARYTPSPVAGAAEVVAGYREEVRTRLPTRPLAALATDFPGAKPQQFASPSEVPPGSLTVHGLVVDGVHYTGECATRLGAYPYCEVLDLPSYSLSKSIIGGIATMRLAALYPDLVGARIADWVPECAGRGGWKNVTVQNTLDMATGRFLSAADQHDEDAPDMLGFFLADSHAEKLKFGCTHYPHRGNPGELWVYHTADTYVLGTVLNVFYRAKGGGDADFYRDVLAKEIWPALHLSPVLGVPRRTYDAAQQVFTGYGLTLHSDDVAKIAAFLNVEHGRIGNRQMLDGRLLDAALQRSPEQPGLRAGSDDLRYKHGFWAWNAQRALGCREPTWIPFMSGYGGIVVALLPNGMTYYYFSDGGVFRWAIAAAEADRIHPFCKR